MNAENHMVANLNRDLDQMFPAATGQRREDKVKAIAEGLWFDAAIVAEGMTLGGGFEDAHQALLAGDTEKLGQIIITSVENYINEVAEQRA
jgi:hypothetical protein